MDKSKAVWTNEKSDEAIMRLMTDCGMPENTTLYRAFKQLENEIVQSAWAALAEQDERTIACVNAFAGIDTERIAGKSLGEFLAGEVRLNKAEAKPDGSFGFSFSGFAVRLMAGAFAEQFKASGAINYLELTFKHDDVGPMTVTMQRVEGLTPVQKLAAAEQRAEAAELRILKAINQRWCPDVDPITGRKLFMWLNHPDLGYVPTYGGPYDSYTLAERDNAGGFSVHRYDHDRGAWVEDECVCVQVVEEWLPSDQVELDEYVKENAPGAERSADPGLQHPIITSPDTDPRRGDFKCESTGEFYRTQMGSVPGREFMLYRNEAESLYLGLRDALCSTAKEA
ncbi:hypothetical protein [Serratia silvae]|uniref:Uncharacterized protein n=1 Tax=Serratia silvae TaxID=2824122 RepID=A0ABT0KID8_9GAMM|nr:hypothetical protein [Serratia silvae]MCL1031333.1 hypothetical protein [Serratia silvae]